VHSNVVRSRRASKNQVRLNTRVRQDAVHEYRECFNSELAAFAQIEEEKNRQSWTRAR